MGLKQEETVRHRRVLVVVAQQDECSRASKPSAQVSTSSSSGRRSCSSAMRHHARLELFRRRRVRGIIIVVKQVPPSIRVEITALSLDKEGGLNQVLFQLCVRDVLTRPSYPWRRLQEDHRRRRRPPQDDPSFYFVTVLRHLFQLVVFFLKLRVCLCVSVCGVCVVIKS